MNICIFGLCCVLLFLYCCLASGLQNKKFSCREHSQVAQNYYCRFFEILIFGFSDGLTDCFYTALMCSISNSLCLCQSAIMITFLSLQYGPHNLTVEKWVVGLANCLYSYVFSSSKPANQLSDDQQWPPPRDT